MGLRVRRSHRAPLKTSDRLRVMKSLRVTDWKDKTMFGKKKDAIEMSKKEETSHEEPELPAPRTYTRSESLGGVGRPSLSDVPRRLPDIGAPRRSDPRGESNPSADGDDSK